VSDVKKATELIQTRNPSTSSAYVDLHDTNHAKNSYFEKLESSESTASGKQSILEAGGSTDESDYVRYLRDAVDSRHRVSEHEYYETARMDYNKQYRERIKKLMDEWEMARVRVQEVKAIDEKGAEKLNGEINARFRKVHSSLEREAAEQRGSMSDVHEQRVLEELDVRRQEAMDHYVETLTSLWPDTNHILRALQHYIRLEQKIRLHAVRRYRHTRDLTDPARRDLVRSMVGEVLRDSSTRVQAAVDMLERAGRYETKLRSEIEPFLKTFNDEENESLAEIMPDPPSTHRPPTSLSHYPTGTARRATLETHSESTSLPQTRHSVAPMTSAIDDWLKKTDVFSGNDEGQSSSVKVHSAPHVAHVDNSQLVVHEKRILKASNVEALKDEAFQLAAPLGILSPPSSSSLFSS